jgi:biotin transport system substrate-specific component
MLNARSQTRATALWTRVALVLAGSMLMALSARLSIVVGPVPITGQTLALPIVVALLGTNLGTTALVAYLAEGALGLPVFASGTLLGPSAGYLLAMPPAAFLIGWLFDHGLARDMARRAIAIFCGTSLVIACGASYLALLTHSASAGFKLGVLPFLIGDAAKIVIAAAVPVLWPRIAKSLGNL